jgi:hypothetical protein
VSSKLRGFIPEERDDEDAIVAPNQSWLLPREVAFEERDVDGEGW